MLQNYTVESKSRKDLRNLAYIFRKGLGISDKLYVPIVEIFEVLPEIFTNFNFEILPDDNFQDGVHAETDICTGHVVVRESVYDGACDGSGRDRMTLAHEIGHYFTICHCGFKLHRSFDHKIVSAFNDPEWQAKCFAGELMVPYELVGNMRPYEIAEKCGVSLEAATYQYIHIN